MTNDKLREALAFAEGWLAGCLIPPTTQQDAEAIPHLRTLIATAKAALAAPVEAEPVARDAWKEAVIECCIVDCIGWHEDDPGRTVRELCIYEAQIALDPLVSADAQALIEKGREEAAHPAEQGKDAEDAIPREPTKAMRLAAFEAYERGDRCLNLWYAMYDAARNTKPAKGTT